jgi:hypothetical protein
MAIGGVSSVSGFAAGGSAVAPPPREEAAANAEATRELRKVRERSETETLASLRKTPATREQASQPPPRRAGLGQIVDIAA